MGLVIRSHKVVGAKQLLHLLRHDVTCDWAKWQKPNGSGPGAPRGKPQPARPQLGNEGQTSMLANPAPEMNQGASRSEAQ